MGTWVNTKKEKKRNCMKMCIWKEITLLKNDGVSCWAYNMAIIIALMLSNMLPKGFSILLWAQEYTHTNTDTCYKNSEHHSPFAI